MKKTFLIITILYSFITYAQTIEKIGAQTCDCIHKNEKDISFDKKFEQCAILLLVKKVKTDSINDATILNKNIDLVKQYIEKNCEATIKTNKIKLEDLKDLAETSCKCIENVDHNGKSKLDSVKKCISSSLTLYQMMNSFKRVNVDSTSTRIQPKKVNLIIINNTDSRMYKQLESYLLNNCNYLNVVINTDNTKHVNSLSFNRKANEQYEIANNYKTNKDLENAIEHYKKAVAIDENFAFAWDNLGISYRRNQQYKKAIKAYKMSLKANPKGRVPLMNIGVAYNALKQHKKAAKSYTKLIENYKEDPEGYYGLAKSYLFLNKNKPALINMIKALQLYTKINSPYRADAEKLIWYIHDQMKKNNQFDLFKQIMDDNGIEFEK